jgi:hypothetical protein
VADAGLRASRRRIIAVWPEESLSRIGAAPAVLQVVGLTSNVYMAALSMGHPQQRRHEHLTAGRGGSSTDLAASLLDGADVGPEALIC